MSRGDYGRWRPYVSVGQRRMEARREVEKLRKKGKQIEPVRIEGRTIARSFWGKGWCEHLESFGDYENRLPRGRTYARNGSVCHLGIKKGEVEAIVSGSELYNVEVKITPLKKTRWKQLKSRCTGKIGSLIELLQGRLSDEIMGTVTDRKDGLFPQPGEIKYSCDCPDWAGMCKHIAAVMYGIGARLDDRPELLFLLRGVDHEELISAQASSEALVGSGSRRRGRRVLTGKKLEDVFGVDLESGTEGKAKPAGQAKARKTGKRKVAAKKTAKKKPAKKKGKVAARKPAPFGFNSRAVTALRKRHGMNKAEFARALGVSAPTVGTWENAGGAINPGTRGRDALRRLHEREEL